MDNNSIGGHAGQVWNLLNQKERWGYEELKTATGLSVEEVYAAVGWLAREDKLFFGTDPDTGKEYLSLGTDFYF